METTFIADVDRALGVLGQRVTSKDEALRWQEEGEAFEPREAAERIAAERQRVREERLERVAGGDAFATAAARANALAPWAARIASGGDVDAWRRNHLPANAKGGVKFLRRSQADAWIREEWRRSPIPGAIGPDGSREMWARLDQLRDSDGTVLSWRTAGRSRREVVRWWRVPPGHPSLSRLAEVARRLARRFSWSEADATMFVLCGARPVPMPIRATYEARPVTIDAVRAGVAPRGLQRKRPDRGKEWPAEYRSTRRVYDRSGRPVGEEPGEVEPFTTLEPVDCFGRVVAELDPMLTVDEVAAWWRGVREALEPDGKGWPVMGEVALELARWTAEADPARRWDEALGRWVPVDGDEPMWEALRRRWNESHEHLAAGGRRARNRPRRGEPAGYFQPDATNFSAAARSAVRRLLSLGVG